MFSKLLTLTASLAICSGCLLAQLPAQGRLQVVDIPSVFKSGKPVYLSDIASSVRYVALETTNKYLIGEKAVQIIPCGGLIFVLQHQKPVGVFDSDGKFLRTIGRIGRGPGEFNFDYTGWPDETTKCLYIWNADAGTIMAFSWDGKHMVDIKPAIKPGTFVPLGNNRFVTWTFMQEHDDTGFYRIVIHDVAGKTLKKIYEPKKKYDFSRGIAIMTPLFTPAEGGFLYNTWENDTILRFLADGSCQPALAWNPGKLKMPSDFMTADYNRYMREKDNYMLDFNALESSTRWFASFYYKGRKELLMLDKKSGMNLHVANQDTATKGLFNDIDGGPSFWPNQRSAGANTFFTVIQAIDLISPDAKKPSGLPVKDPVQAKKLRELVARLTENSNPVLMLVELR